jgi:hypothetical protein
MHGKRWVHAVADAGRGETPPHRAENAIRRGARCRNLRDHASAAGADTGGDTAVHAGRKFLSRTPAPPALAFCVAVQGDRDGVKLS